MLNLLEFSRNKEFSKESFNLPTSVAEDAQSASRADSYRGQNRYEIDENLTLFADKQRIQQAFLNLISNAVQAIDGEGEVLIRANKFKDGMAHVVIRDTGHGISEEDPRKYSIRSTPPKTWDRGRVWPVYHP